MNEKEILKEQYIENKYIFIYENVDVLEDLLLHGKACEKHLVIRSVFDDEDIRESLIYKSINGIDNEYKPMDERLVKTSNVIKSIGTYSLTKKDQKTTDKLDDISKCVAFTYLSTSNYSSPLLVERINQMFDDDKVDFNSHRELSEYLIKQDRMKVEYSQFEDKTLGLVKGK
jgi:hypothetical protein